jgi:transcriptional regulator with XRE-family HTH domain
MKRKATHTLAIREAMRTRPHSLGMTQSEVADRFDIASTNFVSMLESGAVPMPISRAHLVAAFLQIGTWEVIRAIILENEGGHLASYLPRAA